MCILYYNIISFGGKMGIKTKIKIGWILPAIIIIVTAIFIYHIAFPYIIKVSWHSSEGLIMILLMLTSLNICIYFILKYLQMVISYRKQKLI